MGVSDPGHGLAQGRVGGPLAPVIELEGRRSVCRLAVVVVGGGVVVVCGLGRARTEREHEGGREEGSLFHWAISFSVGGPGFR
ncbi:hypothetical protein D3C87_1787140 [compost metagenome]